MPDLSGNPSAAYGIFGDPFDATNNAFATALYRPTPGATFPPVSAANPLAIPPAQPPIYPSGPNAASAPMPSRPPIYFAPPGPAGAAGAPAANNPMPGSGIGGALAGGINSGINNHALTLMALGAGIAQGGVGKGLADAATAAAADRNRQLQQLNFLQSYNALTGAGVPPQQAQAAIGNPSLMRAVATKYFGARAQTNAPVAPAGADIPGRPAGVPNGASYSPSRAIWQSPDGGLFNQKGEPL